jgi:putative protein-disulfide isomerase
MMEKPTLVYCYDALCGWCYGFSPVMERLKKDFSNDFEFEILSGGMMLGSRTGPIGKVAPFVKTAYKTVEQYTGILFGEAFLNDLLGPGNLMLNSWKPSLALTAFKNMQAGDAFAFASALQRAVYIDGLSTDDDATFEAVARQFSLDPKAFLDFMLSESVQQQTRDEFKRVQRYGVTGFPTLLMAIGSDFAPLVSGYRSYDDLAAGLKQLLQP